MKKLIAATLVTGLAISPIASVSANAATGNSMDSVKQIEQGDTTLEGATLGDSIQTVLKENKNPVYSTSADGKEHIYEFHKDNGKLVVTTDGKKDKGHITRVSMSYNDTDGPSYKDVKKQLSDDAVTREHYNSVTGNFGYIQDDRASYQFSSQSPDDKNIKLYRIDIGE
ncbi:SA0570 family protein [Staphylococcus pettenkoferi]|uniref:Uncharacterized protein n=1 Tax=Staphylococcus pettenkoferi TaxID=170573 RepID=A0A9Q4H215_9STAP|nr:hypothetical protein [Staphylococcus pettenkoferi]MCI2803232.1 hypothetical protein [Staphylococcus pettenkoferi]MCY1564485.1 hypothetical protein [Staphylococcus pettenkoferi]MCY1569029.1 hypothetical protein [Staphylococcus pettenkoferi]MCY1572306.1 hypothetical protein [Staphylococcus pettenkoferi]MCY1574968.1 hypothetical protein [Staphylococcus pettenkoferi]